MISKTNYKPRVPGFYLLSGIVKIVDGIITILIFLFGYTCDLYPLFCEWTLMGDAKRRKKHEISGHRPIPSPTLHRKPKMPLRPGHY
jgi:hypothetical protein